MNYTKLLVKEKRWNKLLRLVNQCYKYSFHQTKQNKDQSLLRAEEQLRRVFIYYKDLIKDLILQGGLHTYFLRMSLKCLVRSCHWQWQKEVLQLCHGDFKWVILAKWNLSLNESSVFLMYIGFSCEIHSVFILVWLSLGPNRGLSNSWSRT